MKKICVMGCGYVGLVSGAGLAQFGNYVTCFDIDRTRIEKLRNNIMPIYEPGLQELVEENNKAGRLDFADDLGAALKDRDAVFIAVQTPQDVDGNANLEYLYAAAEDIADITVNNPVVVIKSTVPVGTAREVSDRINAKFRERNLGYTAEVVSNPEFLIEGKAVKTFLEPDRIVIGCRQDERVCSLMRDLYSKPADEGREIIVCSNETAETIKYAANSFLAMKISFINQMALLCGETGADIDTVAKALGSDSRINPRFLNPGPGYGGSCFPKDTKALVRTAEKYGVDMSLVREADDSNERHKEILADKIASVMKKAGAGNIAVWGLSFKAGTGDLRNSPAIAMVNSLYAKGIHIKAYDPKAMKEAELLFKKNSFDIELSIDMYKTLEEADALLIATEWECFRESDISMIASLMKGNLIFDYRNIFDPIKVKSEGMKYYGVGRRYETD
jgi:UDPglucose 6-dehydrogenase